VEYRVITMTGWQPDAAPGYGWPPDERSWVNPSPNAPNLGMARLRRHRDAGGHHAVGGRGTTRPLELFGAPDIDAPPAGRHARPGPDWLRGCRLRECWFEPTFHKHAGSAPACRSTWKTRRTTSTPPSALAPAGAGLQGAAPPAPDYPLWRDFAYEYEHDRLAIDLINGSPLLREWVDDASAPPAALDALARADEQAWRQTRQAFAIYE
jgi:hypothetical protein